MEDKYLLPSEEYILKSDDKSVILTTHRIRHEVIQFGKTYLTSIFLKNVSSVEVKYKSKPIYVILGIFSIILGGLGGVSQNEESYLIIGFVLGILLIFLYLISRKHLLSIYSNGGCSIDFKTKGMRREKILQFIYELEKAIQNTLN